MEFHSFLVLLFSTSLLLFGTIGSTLENLSIEDTVIHLKQKLTEVEERLSSIENQETSDLIQKLSMAVREAEKRILDDKNQLLGRMEEMEMEAKEARKDLSAKLQEMEERESKREEEIIKRVEMRCGDISARLQNAEERFLRMDTHLLLEVQQAQEKSAEAIERVRDAEQEVESALESKTDIFQVKMNETLNYFVASHRDTENAIRKNISSSTEKLIHLNNSLSSTLDSVATKVRIFENSLLEIEKDYANASFVSKLDQSLKNLDNAMKTDIQSIESQLSPRVKELEERCTQCENVTEMNKSLRNLTSQIAALNTDLLDIQTRLDSCQDDPPVLPNGKAIDFDRKHGSKVPYECDESYFLASRSAVHCNRGHWEGRPPVCSYFDDTFNLQTSHSYWIGCYSAFNSQKTNFSRVLDTGSGTHLPGTVNARPNEAFLNLNSARPLERYGSFQCGFSDERGFMNVAVQLQNTTGDLYFEDHSKVANIGDAVDLEVRSNEDRSIGWRHDGVDVPSWRNRRLVEIPTVQPSDAGIYECYYEGQRGVTAPALLRLIVRKCKKNLFGEHCDQQCPACYNGGICQDYLGVCVCPPGFRGNNCEVPCGSGKESPNCRYYSDLKYRLYCLPDPYGCSCARGWKGIRCDEPCENGRYGADCKQPCHCVLDSADCNRFIGVCPGGCSSGWTGQSCQIQVVS